jgi:hypothetical protein
MRNAMRNIMTRHQSSSSRRALFAALIAIATTVPASCAKAQHGDGSAHGGQSSADPSATSSMPGMPGMASMQGAADATMSEEMSQMAMNPHMRMTASRPATAADSARARALTDTLRRALAKYKDVKVAEADGYRQFAPQVKNQHVYHFTRNRAAIKAAFTFDASDPTSLLYTKAPNGTFTLVGAMYTAPRRASEDDLDARVPLSIAHWHEHVNICIPRRGDAARWKEMRDGKLLFGPSGLIATREECDENDGRWFDHLFGWMVHANVFAGTDLATVWGDDHAHQEGQSR